MSVTPSARLEPAPAGGHPPAAAPAAQPALGDEHAAFVQSGVAIHVASGAPGLQPVLARGLGCRLSADRRSATILLAASRSQALLDAVRAGGGVAAVFCLPSTHRTLQLKGRHAQVVPSGEDAMEVARRATDGFLADVMTLGFLEPVIRTMLGLRPDDLAAVRFTIDAAFMQTPGPRAGERLSSAP